MIIDKQLELSDAQALTGTAASTNVIDLGYANADSGTGETMYLVVTSEADLGGTSPTIEIALQESADNSTFTDVVKTAALTSFDAGTHKVIPLPRHQGRYIRANYTLGGTSPTATVSAAIVQGEQAWYAYPDALAKIGS